MLSLLWALSGTFFCVSLALFCVLYFRILGAPWQVCPTLSFSGRSSSPGYFNGLVNRLVMTSLFGQGVFSLPFSFIFLGRLIGLLKAIAELIRIYCPAVGIASDCQTRYVARRSCQNPFLLLFDWHLLLVLSLICFSRGEEINFSFIDDNFSPILPYCFLEFSSSL